jgi:hypothetical protein
VLIVVWKSRLIWVSLIGLLFACFPLIGAEAAAGSQKKVTLPSFSIQINGQPVDNTHLRYPFFVYNDITYLPLTYHDWPVYRGIDGKLYLIRKNNDLANYTDNTSVMWYDDQLLVAQ